jgi:hypothetical protein
VTIPPGRYQGLLLSVILSWALLLRAMISFRISVVPPKIGWMGRCWKWRACGIAGTA